MLTVYLFICIVLLNACRAVARTLNRFMWPANVSSAQAETRAEFAERSVAKLEKTIDDLEGMSLFHFNPLPFRRVVFTKCKYQVNCDVQGRYSYLGFLELSSNIIL